MEWVLNLLGLSKLDFEEINEWLLEADVDEKELIEFIQDQVDDLVEKYIWDINIKALVLEYLCSKADVSELIEYICVEEDGSAQILINMDDLIKIMFSVAEEDRNPTWFFLTELLEINLFDDPNNNSNDDNYDDM